ncbi:LSU ribosomal protein L21P [Chthonomonas calidirosea]|uniref:Large ribosomal subunit protein bL21 n=1 Tax=Chthonomonas calidirosea (strain DSM 23976 / ICMP 18418 / T49) TaxID=1303518 RepID=S0EUB0_CHTCT|nr:50S ribosomal protein L21 [Chthonomonas calidirosea]CCW34854.1 LSU ribosomal protein L21P [Chthonomonas calidirosea T49]CEK12632.1 LSU ribosomal protein L21P [Chthonomonas calidirosea]CEK12633.1 LSU ribosomal protein L21P [Chthonomonas calidirosea]CEK13603.1 LSU ribosomal protein L21P [Chthonomonas calidirosea]
MYAIIKTGGKQYRVSAGDRLVVEKLPGEPQTSIELSEVLLVQTDDNLKIGNPLVEGAKVTATILEQTKGKKIKGLTYKPKKNERRRYGHRQQQTILRVDAIHVE